MASNPIKALNFSDMLICYLNAYSPSSVRFQCYQKLGISFLSYMYIFFVAISRLTGREKRVGGFDLMWNDGPVYMDDTTGADCIPNPSYPTNTFLGKML